MKISIIGTVGVPANYGGFETLVEQLIRNSHSNIDYNIYCSAKVYNTKIDSFHGAKLHYINLNANGKESVLYDIISLLKATKDSDAILILGVSGTAFLPIYRLFSKKRLIVNIDGLEHKRDKWKKWAKRFLKFSEKQAIRYCDSVITDNQGIKDYVTEEYGIDAHLIAYGGDHALTHPDEHLTLTTLNKYKLVSGEYALGICRIVPENNVETILRAFENSNKTLVFVGNWDNSEYGKHLATKYGNLPNVRIIQAIYDIKTLNVLRSNCKIYLHGHSAGGTNPSLVEAMFFEKPICAFDCIYNRETTENKALYFKNERELTSYILTAPNLNNIAIDMKEIAHRRYRWEYIANQYEALFQSDSI